MPGVADEYFGLTDRGPNVDGKEENQKIEPIPGRAIDKLSPFDGSLPAELKLRTANQGMEGLTITPDGKTLVGIMQRALKTPGLDGSAKTVPFARIVTVNLETKKTAEYVYPIDNPKKTKVANSEITALTDTTFVVDERDGEMEPGANKKLWTVDITGATDVGPESTVTGARYDGNAGGLVVGDKALETLVGQVDTDTAVKTLQDSGITATKKTTSFDLSGTLTTLNKDGAFFGHDKVEGVAVLDGGKKFVISNDSDFGIDGITNDKAPFALKRKELPNGTQDTGEILIVDTTKLPAKVTERTVSVEVK